MDVWVYLTFMVIVVFSFALIGSRALTFDPYYRDPLYPQTVDPYTSDYASLSKMIFITYVMSSYDNFPDNQWLAIQNYEPNYIFFIVFILLNLFLFTTIPGSLVYQKFRSTYSKLILLD